LIAVNAARGCRDGVLAVRFLLLVAAVSLAACSQGKAGDDCKLDRSCPGGMTCFADFKCYPASADPGCSPPCYGTEPFCDKQLLRCVACLSSTDCDPGKICLPPVMRCESGCDQTRPDCPDPGSHCDFTINACRGCANDNACTDPSLPRCNTASGLCDACLPTSADCGAGRYCDLVGGRYVCLTGCTSDAECSDGGATFKCCGDRCVDTTSSSENCGGCGQPCVGNESCCDSQCADLSTDSENCTACGRTCALPGVASPQCDNGVCKNSGCEFYYGDCDHDPTNGCETNVSYDGYNCTNCGHVCPFGAHQVPTCTLGSCSAPTCASGWGDCNNNGSDGCETSLDQVNSCGGCLVKCTGAQQCRNGHCV
jgi:hypothetical protein